jgi:hypothetical protein
MGVVLPDLLTEPEAEDVPALLKVGDFSVAHPAPPFLA